MNLPEPNAKPATNDMPVIGWREWVGLPDIGLLYLKAKIDTGARSSCLHAVEIESFDQAGELHVRFKVHPIQRSTAKLVTCEAKIFDVRDVRSSSGEVSERYVIQTTVRWKQLTWPVELTLADRSSMGFRMLMGREAVRGRALVNAGESYFGGRPKRKRR